MLDGIEKQFSTAPILNYTDFKKMSFNKTDAFQVIIGAVLTQAYNVEREFFLCLCHKKNYIKEKKNYKLNKILYIIIILYFKSIINF